MNEEADRGAHAHGGEYDDGKDWILHWMACRSDCAGWRGRNLSRARRGPPRPESGAASIPSASVLVAKIDSCLNLSHGVFDEMHGPLAMAALVQRRRLQGLHRRFERGQGALHIALIGFGWQRGKRQGGSRGSGGRHSNHVSAGRRRSHCFLFHSVRWRKGRSGEYPFWGAGGFLILEIA